MSSYAGADIHALFPSGIDFCLPRHACFENAATSTDPATGDETETFDSVIVGGLDDGSGIMPIILTGARAPRRHHAAHARPYL